MLTKSWFPYQSGYPFVSIITDIWHFLLSSFNSNLLRQVHDHGDCTDLPSEAECGQLFGFNLDMDRDDILDEDLDPEIVFNPKGGRQQAEEEEVTSNCEDDPQPSTSGTRPTTLIQNARSGLLIIFDI